MNIPAHLAREHQYIMEERVAIVMNGVAPDNSPKVYSNAKELAREEADEWVRKQMEQEALQ